jgi:hypothetical protein
MRNSCAQPGACLQVHQHGRAATNLQVLHHAAYRPGLCAHRVCCDSGALLTSDKGLVLPIEAGPCDLSLWACHSHESDGQF